MAVRARLGWLLALMLFTAALSLPRFAAADGEPDPEEVKVLAELFTLGRSLEETRGHIAQLDQQVQQASAQAAELEAERDRLAARRAERVALYRKRVRFYHERGSLAPMGVLLGASSFGEFLTRLGLLQRILDRDAMLLQEMKELKESVEGREREIKATRDQLTELRTRLRSDEAKLRESIAQREAILVSLRERRAAVEAQLAELERVWEESARPVLEALGTILQSMDVAQFQPDSVKMSLFPPGATAVISEKNLNRFFSERPELKGLLFRIMPAAATLEGQFETVPIKITGRFTVSGKTALRYEIKEIQIREFKVPAESVSSLLAESSFDIDVGHMTSPFSVVDVRMEEGAFLIKAGLR